ncbi:MAG: PEP-CTERM sorting domain-containing protein [Pseudomonadota bacterium]
MAKLSKILFFSMLCFVFTAGVSGADYYTLKDGNSTAKFDTDFGMKSWEVDGTNHLFQQSFYYRVGGGAEANIGTLTLGPSGTFDTNFDTLKDTLFARYLGAGFDVEVRYSLDGGAPGSRRADIAEQVSITNTGSTALDFHFFQFSDFDLNGTSGDDSAAMNNQNTVRQWDSGLMMSETVVIPTPDRYQIDNFPNLWGSLIDGSPTDLNNSPGIGSALGPGDVAWAFQWDFNLSPGDSFQISKDKQISPVPEPATMFLLGSGLIGLIGFGRRRSGRLGNNN